FMLTVVAAALWFGRIASVSHVACIALGVVLLIDPWAVLWPGFWLSFTCVAIILFSVAGRVSSHVDADAGRMQRWVAWIREEGRTQLALTLGLVPITMLLFGQISIVSPLANAIAIPLVSFFVTPTALIASILPQPLSTWLLNVDHGLIEILAQILTW